MFAKPNKHAGYDGHPLFTGSFYFYTEDIDTLWEVLKNKASVKYPIGNFEHHMRKFAIVDNNGHLLQFG